MSGPRVKRPFAGAATDPAQRHITNFFGRSPAESPASTTTATAALASSSAAAAAAAGGLPASVQSNLLTVGMRVRKSVPEGYKTGGGGGEMAAFAFKTSDAWAAPTTAALAAAAATAAAAAAAGPGMSLSVHPPVTGIYRNPSAVMSSRRELLPFCGLHKVGGLAIQPPPPPRRRRPGHDDYDDDDDQDDGTGRERSSITFHPSTYDDADPVPESPPGLTSSQDSVATEAGVVQPFRFGGPSASGTTRKRLHSDETDDRPDRPVTWRDTWLDGEISPRTTAPPDAGGRLLAVPRRRSGERSRKAGPDADGEVVVVGSDDDDDRLIHRGGGVGVSVPGAGGDFDEAEFLEYRRSWEAHQQDFEMGGM